MKYLFIIILLYTNAAVAQYNFYYGNIHSHTDYSDGNKDNAVTGVNTPGASFAYAKGSYHIDFWGISEHNHFNANNNPGMLLYKYDMGLYQADTSNQNGLFVAMYGMEWGTISTGGHIVTYGVPDLIGWEIVAGNPNYDVFCNVGDYDSYWNIVNTYPNSFSTLAHPETGDYNDLLLSAPFNLTADSTLVGTAVRSGSAFSTTTDYTDPPAPSYEFQYRRALAKGYHIGPAVDHDNHYTTFGRTVQGRTVVLASQLHRDTIITAYKARRFYASDDWNTEVDYTVNGAVMGSQIETENNTSISISINDLDITDTTANIQIYHGVPGSGTLPSVLTSLQNSNTLTYTHVTALNSHHYYYAKITQKDGDIIWTAPVWIHRVAFPLPEILLSLTAEAKNQDVEVKWETTTEQNLSTIELQHSADGTDFNTVSTYTSNNEPGNYNYLHLEAAVGNNFYRLKMTDVNGDFTYSLTASAFVKNTVASHSVFPNPAEDILHISYICSAQSRAAIRIYNMDGREVFFQNIIIYPNENLFTADVSCLPEGLYYIVIQKENERLVDEKFMKL